MKTFKNLLIFILSLGFLLAAVLFLIGYFKPKPGGILVSTSPASSVYINGNLVGRTPFQGSYQAGQITIKLVPEAADPALLPYETKVMLASGIQTVVRREFGSSENTSSGDVISFEREGKDAGLVVISTPDNAQVSIDGVPRGFAPYRTSAISPAEHQITVKAPGYTDRVMTLKTLKGFRLTVFAKLAQVGGSETPEAEEPVREEVYVEILPTSTGFLRVRSEPGTAGREIDQIKPGDKYLFLEEDAAPGLPDGRSGWVSNEYATRSATPSFQIPATDTPL